MCGSSLGNQVNTRTLGREKEVPSPGLRSQCSGCTRASRAVVRGVSRVKTLVFPQKIKTQGIPMISVLTVVPRLEGRPEIAVLDGHERDGSIDGASVCIDGLDLGSCTDAPRSFQKLLRREGKELGLKTLADNFGFLGLCYSGPV
ncbi:hypothetical protein CXB51_000300 [Gossypium anomalum]|uniref:Uncharacterized protein n=1 Tax=Gossypium anomalum TaxID=47600 RepID=A0A8J5Z415_9ROSI|nr:hypothetical protein CXB51_000300 [Gossypium anomalum]